MKSVILLCSESKRPRLFLPSCPLGPCVSKPLLHRFNQWWFWVTAHSCPAACWENSGRLSDPCWYRDTVTWRWAQSWNGFSLDCRISSSSTESASAGMNAASTNLTLSDFQILVLLLVPALTDLSQRSSLYCLHHHYYWKIRKKPHILLIWPLKWPFLVFFFKRQKQWCFSVIWCHVIQIEHQNVPPCGLVLII